MSMYFALGALLAAPGALGARMPAGTAVRPRAALSRAHPRLAAPRRGLGGPTPAGEVLAAEMPVGLAIDDLWDEDEDEDALSSYFSSLKTGGTPEAERVLEPPPGYVPFALRAEGVTPGDLESDPDAADALDRYLATLKAPAREDAADDETPITLKGDQALDKWLLSLKTGGTPEAERVLTPPEGYVPMLERQSRALGLETEVVLSAAQKDGDAMDAWMESLRTGGTPEHERVLVPPEGHVPFSQMAQAGSGGRRPRGGAAAAQGPAAQAAARMRAMAPPPAKPKPAPQPVAPPPQPVAAAPARAPSPSPVMITAPVAPAPVTLVVAPPAPAPVRTLVGATMSAATPSAEEAMLDEAMHGLGAWLARPAGARNGEAGASMRAAVASVSKALAEAASQPQPAAYADMRAAAAALSAVPPNAAAMRAAPRAPEPAAVVLPRMAAPTAVAAPAAAAARPGPRRPSAALVDSQRAALTETGYAPADADDADYDPEEIEPERLAYDGKPPEALFPLPAGSRLNEAPPPLARPKREAPSGPMPGMQAYMDTLPGDDTPLPSGVEELRGFSSQYKIEGMENMTMKEYRAAMDAKVSRTVKQWRAKRPVVGSETVLNYMDSLNRPPRDD